MMTEQELLAIIEAEEKRALGYGDGELSAEREQALKYYNGDLYGNEQEGRSSIVTREVADTVEWILPTLLDIFTASDKAVEFQPEKPNDEEATKQATDTCNYVFYKQNNGFVALYSFFKDALIQKNGYVKVYYEKGEKARKETYRGLTQGQFMQLLGQPNIEVKAHSEYPDPSVPPMAPMAMAVGGAMGQPPQVSMLHDVIVEVTQQYGKVCVDPVPPEEMLISVDLGQVDLQKATFVAHRCQKTLSDLADMGYDTDELSAGGDDDNVVESSGEWLERRQYDEEQTYSQAESAVMDPTMRKVWVTEAYIRADYDGDGIAELRKVMKCGRVVLENEETDVIPFAAITPVIMTHRHIGKSVADLIMDLQLIKSTLMRQVLDNIYFTNSPRQAVLSNSQGVPQANLDDLLTVRPGGVVREYVPNAVRPLTVPFMGQYGLQVMEYIDTVGAKRTGVTENLAGLDSDSLNKTARGATITQNNAMMRIKLIARIFAETGVKAMFKLILHCLATHQDKAMIVRLTDKFVEVDPRGWDTSWDMTVNVGLGTGNKDQQLGHLQAITQAQIAFMQAGLPIVNPKNIYNVQARIVENAGFKSVEEFWTDPEQQQQQPQQPPQPDPRMIQMQQEQQFKQQQAQADMQIEQAKMQQQAQADERRMQLDVAKSQAQMQLEREKAEQDFAIEQARMQLEVEKTKAQIMLEQLKAKAGIALQREKAQGDLSLRSGIAEMQARQMQEQPEKEDDEDEDRLAEALEGITKSFESVAAALSRPKKLIRGADGRAEGIE